MKKILILSNNDIGLFNFRQELIHKLLSLGYTIVLALPFGKKIDDFTKIGCKFIDTPVDRRGMNPFADIILFFRYLFWLYREKPDIVLTYTIKPNIYGGLACRIMRIPYIVNVTGLGTSLENPGLLKLLTLKLYRIGLKKAFCVFAQNKSNLDFISHWIYKGNIVLLPGSGVNLERFKILEYPTDENINFLFVSRIMKQKGIDQFLEAAEYFTKKYKNMYFHVLGFCEEDYAGKLHDMHNRGIIKYYGMVDDVKNFYLLSHCLIHPSFYPEGMSNVILENSACARPTITTNVSGCKEIVVDGVTGYIFEKKRTDDLIRKIELFLNLSNFEKRKMGIEARLKVQSEYNRDIVINRYIAEIDLIKK